MNRTFDRKAYRQELIDAGFSAEDAETIASRTVMRAPRETFQSVGSMVQQATAKIERDSVQLAPPALPAPSAAVERSRRLEQEAAGLAKSMTIDTRNYDDQEAKNRRRGPANRSARPSRPRC